MKPLFSMLLSFIFAFHTSVQASTPVPEISEAMLAEVVQKYNGLTNQEKLEKLKDFAEANPKDKAFLEEHWQKFPQGDWPKLQLEKDVLTFELNSRKMNITGISATQKTLELDGLVLGFAPGSMYRNHELLTQKFGVKKFSLWSLLIHSAHAEPFVIGLTIYFLVFVALFIGSIVLATQGIKKIFKGDSKEDDLIETLTKFKVNCDQFLNKMTNYGNVEIPAEQKELMLVSMTQFTASLSAITIPAKNKEAVSLDASIKNCIARVTERLAKAKTNGKVNNSSEVKVVPDRAPKELKKWVNPRTNQETRPE